MTKHYVALMSVQFTHATSGERLWAEPMSSTYHGVFDGLDDVEAERLDKLGAIREATKEEIAIASVTDSQTKAIEPSEQALRAAQEAEDAYRAANGGGSAAGSTGGKDDKKDDKKDGKTPSKTPPKTDDEDVQV